MYTGKLHIFYNLLAKIVIATRLCYIYDTSRNVIINNKNVNIKFSARGTFLEKPSSGTLKAKILENQII
jgi:hypothetical protein